MPGDVAERSGSVTAYSTAAALAAAHIIALVRNHSDGDEEPMIALHEQSGPRSCGSSIVAAITTAAALITLVQTHRV
ncbi:hypothetical protein ACH4YO_24570 [Streptomyces noursei]|uniref:hypothetical protein n=1 Tax=Streptomyces noursei TaxID=1971 RepID=UPI0033EE647D